jgi:hypothetical protein
VIRRGEKTRWFRNLPVGSDCTWVIATLPRVQCRDCGLVRQIDTGLADPKRTYTHAFERYVLELSQCTTIKFVAEHLGVSWDIVKDIQKRNLPDYRARPADRRNPVRRTRQKSREFTAFLAATAGVACQGTGGGHRHVASLHQRGRAEPAPGHAGLRSFPRRQADEPKKRAACAGARAALGFLSDGPEPCYL